VRKIESRRRRRGEGGRDEGGARNPQLGADKRLTVAAAAVETTAVKAEAEETAGAGSLRRRGLAAAAARPSPATARPSPAVAAVTSAVTAGNAMASVYGVTAPRRAGDGAA
jgi:hypothetical protein